MAKKNRYVDVLRPDVKVRNGDEPILFEDILRFMENREYRIGEKSFKFTLFDNPANGNYVEGLIITTQDSDIPPKRNKRTGAFSSVDIDTNEEGFAYANVFLYDTVRKVLVYEINKNGCFPRQFAEAVYHFWNNPEIREGDGEGEDGEEVVQRVRFDLSFPILARQDAYNRMLRMNYYKKISIELVNPQGLIEQQLEEDDSIENWLKSSINRARGCNANVIRIEQTASPKLNNPEGLSHSAVQEMVDKVRNLFGRGNIQKLEVQGYTDDVEDSRRCRPVDLLTDAFKEFFKIDDIQVHIDVQSTARKEGIEALYNRILPEIHQILGR